MRMTFYICVAHNMTQPHNNSTTQHNNANKRAHTHTHTHTSDTIGTCYTVPTLVIAIPPAYSSAATLREVDMFLNHINNNT